MITDKKYTLSELKNKLTEKQHAFCHEYILDWNASRAARKAGYSIRTSTETGYENLTKPHIKQYIDLIKDDIAKEAGISKLSLINELKVLASSNLPKIIEKFKTGGLSELSDDEQKCIIEYIGNDSSVKLKLHDKRGAIQDILKAMGWNEPDKINLSTEFTAPSIIVDDEEIANEINKIRDDK